MHTVLRIVAIRALRPGRLPQRARGQIILYLVSLNELLPVHVNPLLAIRVMHSSNGLLKIWPLVEHVPCDDMVVVGMAVAELFPSRKMVDAPVMQLSEELALAVRIREVRVDRPIVAEIVREELEDLAVAVDEDLLTLLAFRLLQIMHA